MPHLCSRYQLVASEHFGFGGMCTVIKYLNLIGMLLDKEEEVCFSAQAYTSKSWLIKLVKKNIMTLVLVFVLLSPVYCIILPCVSEIVMQ